MKGFLKKNLGLLVGVAICLSAIIAILVLCSGEQKKCAKYEEAIKGHKDFFAKVNKAEYQVVANKNTGEIDNLIIAEENWSKIEAQEQRLLRDCIERYTFSPEPRTLPRYNPTKAREDIDMQLISINNRLKKSKVKLQSLGANNDLEFGREIRALFDGGREIQPDEVVQAYRQIEIYRRLVDIVVNSGIKRVEQLELPCGLGGIERDNYKINPLLITVVDTPEGVQRFFNSLTMCPDTFFCIKSLAMENVEIGNSDGTYGEIFLDRFELKTDQGQDNSKRVVRNVSNNSLLTNYAIGPALNGMSGRTSGSSDSIVVKSKERATPTNEDGEIEESINRQSFLVFQQKRLIRMDLNVDIIEFKRSVEEEE